MNITFKNKDKGHDIFIDNQWVMWVVGSLKMAKKEIAIYISNEK